jgi:hypothetical protein
MKKSSHYYRRDGTPCHTQPNKSKPGETRPTTLKDARALGLLPSVTSILDVLSKPQLEDWKLEQMTKEFQRRMQVFVDRVGASSSDIIEGIRDIAHRDIDALHEELADRAFQQVEDAADAGTKIHAAAEKSLQFLEYDENEMVMLPELKASFPMSTFINPIKAFVKEHAIRPSGHEVRIVNHLHGYAGTGDLPMTCAKGVGFGDWKTRKTKPGKPVQAYDTQLMQISAYHGGYYQQIPAPTDHSCGWNGFLSTTEPGRFDVVWYDAKQIADAYHAFTSACSVWRFIKGFDPRDKS